MKVETDYWQGRSLMKQERELKASGDSRLLTLINTTEELTVRTVGQSTWATKAGVQRAAPVLRYCTTT